MYHIMYVHPSSIGKSIDTHLERWSAASVSSQPAASQHSGHNLAAVTGCYHQGPSSSKVISVPRLRIIWSSNPTLIVVVYVRAWWCSFESALNKELSNSSSLLTPTGKKNKSTQEAQVRYINWAFNHSIQYVDSVWHRHSEEIWPKIVEQNGMIIAPQYYPLISTMISITRCHFALIIVSSLASWRQTLLPFSGSSS